MDKPTFRQLFTPELKDPIFVEGLLGFGNVGKIAARFLIEFTSAKPFAELYSPSLPDYVIAKKNGICRPPRYEFYASTTQKPNFIILIGDAQPSLEDVVAHYESCDEILSFVEKYGVKLIVTMGGVPTPQPSKEVYVAATSEKLAVETMEKGAIIYGRGRIVGATGLLLGLAKNHGMEGICLLGPTTGIRADQATALTVFKFLTKMLGIEAESWAPKKK